MVRDKDRYADSRTSRDMLIVLLVITALAVRVDGSCPDKFDLVKDGECRGLKSSYNVYYNDAVNQAIATCKTISGKPIIIHNEEHQSYWRSKVVATWTTIGLVCNTSTLRWMWSDGSAVDYKPPVGFYDAELDYTCASGFSWVMRSDGFWTYWRDAAGQVWPSADFFCTTQLAQPERAEDGCDSFADDDDDGICNQIAATAEKWQEAQLICRSFGADPASVHSAKENSFIRRLAVANGKVTGLYLGASLSGKGADYAWIDGSKWDYDNFYPSFPKSELGECLVMDTESTAGQWINADCSSKLSIACERPQRTTKPKCAAGPFVEGQIIYSPGFPFDASIPCDFLLEVDPSKRVEVEILQLEANNCCDELVIFDDYFGGTVIANLTGEVSDRTFKTKSSNFMRVSWRPNGGVNVRGMIMTYRGV